MYVKKIGFLILAMGCAATMLSAVDAEAACCHRQRRAACCDPCSGTIVESVPCVTTVCGGVCRPVVVEEVVVSRCCAASAQPIAVTEIAASASAAPRPATPTRVLPVSASNRGR